MPTKNIVAVHHFLVVLKMPKTEDAYINKSKGVFKATTDTTKFTVFPTGDPALNPRQFNINIQALDDAQSNLTTKPPLGTAKQRNDAKTVVHDNLESVRLGVQALVNASPKNAYTIAAKAGMEIKVITTHVPKGGSAKKGTVANTWDLIGEGAGHHDWRISADAGKNWTFLPSSGTKKTTTPVLARGVDYLVQSRQVLTKGKFSDWSASIELNN
ncbi:MAG TPA: hypothetical protein VF411_10795 [Bacteroidia bacterium]